MSESRSEKNQPETSGAPREPVVSGTENSDSNENRDESRAAPWTSEVPQVPGPAPMIELDNPVESGSVKPLGPRRLARLQREMAAHAKEIQEAEQANAGEVDQDLLLKQQRFAELALRAAAANEQDRKDAEAALRAADTEAGADAEPQTSQAAEQDTITVSFPQSSPMSSSLAADPLTVDPGQFPSSPIVPASGPNTVSINLVPAATRQTRAATEAAPEEPTSEATEEQSADRQESGVAAPSTQESPAARTTAPEPESPRDAEVEAPPQSTPGAPEPMPSEQVSPPGTPVRAVDAQGLELLEPNDYKQKSGAMVPLLVLLFLVIAALIAVLIIFVL